MQNKGAIRVFAILLALVSLYQLIFTYQTRQEENKAKEIANGDPQVEINYLDSVANEPIYNFFGRKYTYKECKEKEINFGLDLKGGMNLILEVKVADILKALSNYNTDNTFNEALQIAEQKEKSSSEDFITLFYKAFSELDSEARLAAIFNTVELKGKIDYNTSNEEVLKVIRAESQSAIDNAFNILRTRIDRFGVTQPNIQKLEKAGRVLVELPGIKDPQRVRKLLQGTASLEFWETYEITELVSNLIAANSKVIEIEKAKEELNKTEEGTQAAAALETAAEKDGAEGLLSAIESDSTKVDSLAMQSQKSLFSVLQPSQRQRGPLVGYALVQDTSKVNAYLQMDQIRALFPKNVRFLWGVKPLPQRELEDGTQSKQEIYELVAIKVTTHDGRAPLEGDVITNASKSVTPQGGYEVSMRMNAEGSNVWARLTKANIGKSIAVVLDGYVYSYPNVNSEIPNGSSSISGDFDAKEAEDLANILKSGKLPAPARIVEDTVVGPSLGQEAVNSGLSSFAWAFLVVLAYMIFYYGFKAGAVSDIALLANMFFILGVLASFGAVLTLPGIAGIVLTIGMSVDANVLIYERIREELGSGKGVKLAVTDGYKNAFSAIIDSNVTTFLTGLILFMFGTGPIKGFATTLMIGIATSFFSAIFITRLIFERMLNKDTDIKFGNSLTLGFMKNTKVKFLEKRNLFYIISGVVILFGIGSLATQGLKSGIDFSGGRTYVVRFQEDVSATDIQKSLADEFEGAHVEVKTFGGDNQVRVATNYMVDESGEDVDNVIEHKLYNGLKSYVASDASFDDFVNDYRMSSQKVGPTIATDIKTKAYYSIAFSLLVIFLYILIRFRNWEYGLGALMALVHDVLVVLGIFSLLYKVVPFSLEIDQAFIAAILTVIGYSINDTVVVFDRIREYLGLHPKRDRNAVVDSALNSTISRTVNTSLTTFVVLLVIFLFGGETIQGFVFALLIGVVVGTYSSLFIATPIAFTVIDTRAKRKAKK
ncbi:protein translocase subunit SecDF [Plebeiibacterium sediminum]|uniref:Multifunctional fusion protein n=1 Tax=Plebeiibacterium sediminum TaxID=2992112 RepID=A0AAE3SG08_9BACT|nr:protein translocase subunit SecDF [Plebeiobacterium sediminum]MCW3787831.1 protein translocase subunit SecDF [Plebeiobacterium sediminum]